MAEFVTEQMFILPLRNSKNKKAHDAVFRSAIFLPNMDKKELKMHVSYNMERYPDDMIAFPMGVSLVSHVYETQRRQIADMTASKPNSFGDMSPYRIWEDLKSILGVPITDSNETCLGILTIDTDQPYTVAKFDEKALNNMLFLVSKGIGRLLEGYA